MLLAALRRHADVIAISSQRASYLLRLPIVVSRLLLERRPFDVLFLGFLAQPIVPFAILRHRKPLVVDMFISLYETLCHDRKTTTPGSPLGRIARWLDNLSCRCATKVVTDTSLDAAFLARNFDVDRADVLPLYVGANEELFYPRERQDKCDRFRVFYYSTYLPLHGVDVVLRAAKLLEGEEIDFRIVGKGLERRAIDRLAAELRLQNSEFVDWVPYADLPAEIAAADICLAGHFAAGNEKARRVIPGKAFQFVAMAKATVLGDCPASREVFTHGKDAYLVRMGDPGALAVAIRALREDADLRHELGKSARELFVKKFGLAALEEQVVQLLADVSGVEQLDEDAVRLGHV